MNSGSQDSLRINCLIKIMEETFSYFGNILNFINFFSNCNCSNIINLSSWSRIESTSIKNNDISSLFFFLSILKYSYDFSIKFFKSVVFVVEIICLWVANCIIQNQFSSFSNFLSSLSNYCIEVIRNRDFTYFSYCISRNTPTFHNHNPVIKWEFAFVLW